VDVCTCLLTALFAGSNFPDIVGGIKAQDCDAGRALIIDWRRIQV